MWYEKCHIIAYLSYTSRRLLWELIVFRNHNPLILPRVEMYRSVWRQTHYDATDKNNNIRFEGLDIHYHSSYYRTRCYTIDNVCLGLQNWCYSIYLRFFISYNKGVRNYYDQNSVMINMYVMFWRITM
jgi:hypothetical protein